MPGAVRLSSRWHPSGARRGAPRTAPGSTRGAALVLRSSAAASGTGATRNEFAATTHVEVLVRVLFPGLPGTTCASDPRGRPAPVPARHLHVA